MCLGLEKSYRAAFVDSSKSLSNSLPDESSPQIGSLQQEAETENSAVSSRLINTLPKTRSSSGRRKLSNKHSNTSGFEPGPGRQWRIEHATPIAPETQQLRYETTQISTHQHALNCKEENENVVVSSTNCGTLSVFTHNNRYSNKNSFWEFNAQRQTHFKPESNILEKQISIFHKVVNQYFIVLSLRPHLELAPVIQFCISKIKDFWPIQTKNQPSAKEISLLKSTKPDKVPSSTGTKEISKMLNNGILKATFLQTKSESMQKVDKKRNVILLQHGNRKGNPMSTPCQKLHRNHITGRAGRFDLPTLKEFLFLAFLLVGIGNTFASEFPDRECCDSLPPPKNPDYASTTSTTSSTVAPPHRYHPDLKYRPPPPTNLGE